MLITKLAKWTNVDKTYNKAELFKRWSEVGLLEGLTPKAGHEVSIYLQALLEYLVKAEDKKQFGNDLSRIEVTLFPMIRRLYSNGKLHLRMFTTELREDNQYKKIINDYSIISQKVLSIRPSTKFIIQQIKKIFPLIIEDYLKFETIELEKYPVHIFILNMRNEGPDIEAEVLATYCDSVFDPEIFLTKNKLPIFYKIVRTTSA